jgi:hypothetical protein
MSRRSSASVLKSSVVVEKPPGAGSLVGTDTREGAPDGYTLLVGGIFKW